MQPSISFNGDMFSNQLRFFIQESGISLKDIAKVLNLSPEGFLSWWSGHSQLEIEEDHILRILNYFDLKNIELSSTLKELITKRSSFVLNEIKLPERYSINQKSCVRTSAHIIQYLNKTRGTFFSEKILETLGVPSSIYKNLDNKINLIYFIDLLNLLSEKGLTDKELDHLACVLFLSLENTDFGLKMQNSKNYYSCYKILKENIHLFDSNFDYEFEFTTYSVTRSKLDFLKHNSIDWTQVDFSRLFRYRQILSGSIPFLAQLPPIMPKVNLIQNDHFILSEYFINFN